MKEEIIKLIDAALLEDIGPGDVTSEYFVPVDRQAKAELRARASGVLAGVEIAKEVFCKIDGQLDVKTILNDGSSLEEGTVVMTIEGAARSILTAERTALNFLQRLTGIASLTNQFVTQTEGTKAVILDTRKTTPGWRFLEKSAVKAGGGQNHRMGLYDRAMVKDNHLVAEGGIAALQEAINRLKTEKPQVEVELEADTLAQVKDFLGLKGVDYILLDNMTNDELREAIELRDTVGSSVPLEASGGVNLKTVAGIAQTGVDFISVGAITHSAVALDLGLDFVVLENS